MSLGILGVNRRHVRHRRVLRGFGNSSNCSDDDLISCNQSAYDDASSYCDSIGQSGDLTCVQQNMDTTKCPCANAPSGGSGTPGASFTPAPAQPASVKPTPKKKATSTVSVGPSTPSAPAAAQANILGIPTKNLAVGVLAVVGYMVFMGKKAAGR